MSAPVKRGLTPPAYRKDTTAWWAHRRRLAWLYGEQTAANIMAGNDPAANADLAAWNRLGSGQERAA